MTQVMKLKFPSEHYIKNVIMNTPAIKCFQFFVHVHFFWAILRYKFKLIRAILFTIVYKFIKIFNSIFKYSSGIFIRDLSGFDI